MTLTGAGPTEVVAPSAEEKKIMVGIGLVVGKSDLNWGGTDAPIQQFCS